MESGVHHQQPFFEKKQRSGFECVVPAASVCRVAGATVQVANLLFSIWSDFPRHFICRPQFCGHLDGTSLDRVVHDSVIRALHGHNTAKSLKWTHWKVEGRGLRRGQSQPASMLVSSAYGTAPPLPLQILLASPTHLAHLVMTSRSATTGTTTTGNGDNSDGGARERRTTKGERRTTTTTTMTTTMVTTW